MFQKMMDKSVAKSPWLFHVNAGSCNGCDIEIVAALTPRYDAERLGFRLAGSPRQADIVVVSGPVTRQTRDRVIPYHRTGTRTPCHCQYWFLSPFRQRFQGQLCH